MEIQHGKGPWADPVAGIVPLGTTLTMVVGINDKLGECSLFISQLSSVSDHCNHVTLRPSAGSGDIGDTTFIFTWTWDTGACLMQASVTVTSSH